MIGNTFPSNIELYCFLASTSIEKFIAMHMCDLLYMTPPPRKLLESLSTDFRDVMHIADNHFLLSPFWLLHGPF